MHRLADDLGADLRLGGDLRGGGLRRGLWLLGPGAARGECGDGEQPEGGDRDRGGDLVRGGFMADTIGHGPPSARQRRVNLGKPVRTPLCCPACAIAPGILFVEDEQSISAPFSKALEREGFEPHVAATAARALQLQEQLEPDLILLDLHLPDGDGRDVCRTIRAR